jgi:hypothetical protein
MGTSRLAVELELERRERDLGSGGGFSSTSQLGTH